MNLSSQQQQRLILMEMNKEELVKICKQINISHIGSNNNLINRILQKISKRKNSSSHKKRYKLYKELLRDSKNRQKINSLVVGWIAINSNNSISLDFIILTVVKFIGNNFLSILFNAYPKKYKQDILNHGTTIYGPFFFRRCKIW